MLNRTRRRVGAVTLVVAFLAASAGSGPASASQISPKTPSISPSPTTARPERRPARTPPGTLSLVAGRRVHDLGPGPATRASLYSPWGVAVDARGNLFIADSGNNVIEEVTPAGRLSVVAGDGTQGPPTPGPATSSELSFPEGVAVNTHEDLFIADYNNNIVEEVTPAGRLSVAAGDGTQGPPTPGAATSSRLDDPAGVAVDARGDLFIADSGNNVVEEVTPAGRLSVVAGNGKQGQPTPGAAVSSKLYWPVGVAVNARGDLFVADWGDSVVEEVTPAGRLSVVAGSGQRAPLTPGPATRSELGNPHGVAVDAHGDLFVADENNMVVEKVTPAGRLSVVAGDGTQSPLTSGLATRSELAYPVGVAVDAHGDLFVADEGNNVVEEVTPAGRLSVVAGEAEAEAGPPTPGPATRSELAYPVGVAVDAPGTSSSPTGATMSWRRSPLPGGCWW